MKTAEQKMSPDLRFPEFAGEWVSKKLKLHGINVVDGDRGVNYPNGDDFSSDGYCLFLNAKNVTKKGFCFEQVSFITTEKDCSLRKGKLVRNDLILTTRGSVGHVSYYDDSVSFLHMRINSGMVILRVENRDVFSGFIYAMFFSPVLTFQIRRTVFGSAQPQLTVKEVNNFKLAVPDSDEQKKIASFLSAVDGRIEGLEKKRDLLKDYKKGLMQKLFSQSLRFENGKKPFPDWEEKKLGEVAKIASGGTPSRQAPRFWNGNIPWVTTTQINFNEITSVEEFITDEGLKSSSAKLFPKGTLLIALYGQGVTRGKVAVLGIDATTNQACASIQLDKLKAKTEFMFYDLQGKYEKIRKLSNDGGQKNLSAGLVKSIVCGIPCFEEQRKIAECLSAVDRKIGQVETQVEQTRAFKQGLLQKMFV